MNKEEEDSKQSSKRQDELKKNVQLTEHLTELNELLAQLGTDPDRGLSAAAAKEKLRQNGPNELTPPATEPMWKKFIKEMTGFFSLLLWLGSILCFISYGLMAQTDNLALGVVLAFVVFVTGCFSFYQNSKSENLMKAFGKLLPKDVMVIRDGEWKQVDAKNLVLGDIIRLEGGNSVPADIRILSCSDDMVVDNAPLTGESEPQKRTNVSTDENPLETKNLCFFGTQVPEGKCTGVVICCGDNTVMGSIAALAMTTKNEQTPINKEIHHFIKIISAIAIALGVAFFIIGYVMQPDPIQNLVFMIGIIVANVPEGLLATVTVCLTLTAKRMAKKKVLVKNLEGVETLGSTSCICSDKTGTLTQNVMTVAQVVYGDEDTFHIQDCASSFTKGNKTYKEDNKGFQALLRNATLCNVSEFINKNDEDGKPIPFKKQVQQGDGTFIEKVMWDIKGNASEAAMIKLVQGLYDAEDPQMKKYDVESFRSKNSTMFAIPFNSRNKYQVHVHTQQEYDEGGVNNGPRVVLMKGAPERVLKRCSLANLDGNIVPMTDELIEKIESLQSRLANAGLRVLGFAEKELPVAEFPPDYNYHDGKSENYSTPNFPLGEFGNQIEREQLEKEQKEVKEDPIHPKSLEGLVFLGLMALIDPPREAVPGAVAKCKTAGIKVIMVTGDHPDTAQAIAHKVGILWSKTRGEIAAQNVRYNLLPGDAGFEDPEDAQAIVVPGWKLTDDMTEEQWRAILEHPQIVFARTSPQQKLIIVENCQRLGYVVAVTGDGVNDSPALKKADIGVAMGIMGSEVSKNAADMILLDDNFASIVSGVEEGRLIFDNLKKSICYTLTSNIPEISPFLCWIVIRTPMPLSTVLILAIDLGTDMIPAISMAYEQAEADIMLRPPRNADQDRLVTKRLIVFAYLQIGMIQAASGFYTWMIVLNDYGYPPHILMGLGHGTHWGKQTLFCRFSGGQYVNHKGDIDPLRDPQQVPPGRDYPLWDTGDHGYLIDCEYPVKSYSGGGGAPGSFKKGVSSTYTPGKTEGFSQVTFESIKAMEKEGYFAYVPWRARQSAFWHDDWVAWDISEREAFIGAGLGDADPIIYFDYQQAGLWSLCVSDSALTSTKGGNVFMAQNSAEAIASGTDVVVNKEDNLLINDVLFCDEGAVLKDTLYSKGAFCNGDSTITDSDKTCADEINESPHNLRYCKDKCSPDCEHVPLALRDPDVSYKQCQNVASRLTQAEALQNAQAAFFTSIVVVQWADLLICKTRWLSIRQQGLSNSTLNFGLFFETLLAAWLAYCLPINVIGTRNLRLTHWFPGIPFSILIFVYDETRKYLMRSSSPEKISETTGQVTRIPGWLEVNTYY